MADFYCERQIKKTHKKHWCTGCLDDIEVGNPAVYISCVWQGDFQAYYLCPECHEFTHTDEWHNIMMTDDSWSEGYIGEIRRGNNDE